LSWHKSKSKNPPTHADTAPQAEIRQESLDTLLVFSVAIAVSMVLPVIGLIIGGFDSGIQQLGIFGLVLMLVMGILYFWILWAVLKSRQD
jgi:hypothetical protein